MDSFEILKRFQFLSNILIKIVYYILYEFVVLNPPLFTRYLHLGESVLSIIGAILACKGFLNSQKCLLWTYVVCESVFMVYVPLRTMEMSSQLLESIETYFILNEILHAVGLLCIMIIGSSYVAICLNSVCILLLKIYVPEAKSIHCEFEKRIVSENGLNSKNNGPAIMSRGRSENSVYLECV